MKFHKSIKNKILTIQLLTLGFSFILIACANLFIAEIAFKDFEFRYMKQVAISINQGLFDKLQTIKERITILSSDESLQYYNENNKEGSLDYFLLNFKNIAPLRGYVDKNGKVLKVQFYKEELHPLDEFTKTLTYKQAIENPNTVIFSPIVYNELLKEHVIEFAVNKISYFGDESYGVVFGAFSFDKLVESFSSNNDEQLTIRLIGKNEKIHYSTKEGEDNALFVIQQGDTPFIFGKVFNKIQKMTLMHEKALVYADALFIEGSMIFISKKFDDFLLLPLKFLKLEFIIYTISFLLLVVVAHKFLQKHIVQPLIELTTVTQYIRKGDYSHRVIIRTGDEIESLANSVNSMSVELDHTIKLLEDKKMELEKSNVKLHDFNQHLEEKVAERTRELEVLATIDVLTNVHNRYSIMNKLSDEISRKCRYKTALSVLMYDIDDFKKINDTYGHFTGDVVLTKLTNIVKNTIRDIDSIGRYGGEEFIIILPSTPLEDAQIIAERVRKNVEYYTFEKVLHVTISIGLVECIEQDTIDGLFKRLDALLYLSKKRGKNQVTFELL